MTNAEQEEIQLLLSKELNALLEEEVKRRGISKSEVIVSKILKALEQENQVPISNRLFCWLKAKKISEA